jgi:6-phosphogluconate dehydrogenase
MLAVGASDDAISSWEEPMKVGIVGLGRMGRNVARRAMEKGHTVVGYNLDPGTTKRLADEGLQGAYTMQELADKLDRPRAVFVYVPHGPATLSVLQQLGEVFEEGDIVVDGGNSMWSEAVEQHAAFARKGIRFLDIGTSGGVSGARHGAAFMVAGDREAFQHIRALLLDLAVDEQAVFHASEQPGAGHFVKLIHNAIEFGMIQAIAEGVELLRESDYDLDLPALFEHWNHGTVLRSWLIELMGKGLGEVEGGFEDLSTFVEDTGEVKWVIDWALQRDIPTPVTAIAQQVLMYYRNVDSPQAKAVALLRNQFGGHPIHWKDGRVTGSPSPTAESVAPGPTVAT